MMIYTIATAWIPVIFMAIFHAVKIEAEPSSRGLRHLSTNASTATIELIEPAPPLPVLSTLNCWLDPNSIKYVCLLDGDDKAGHVADKCSKKSSPLQLHAVRCWCALTVRTNEASNDEQFMHHCVSCSSMEGSNTTATSRQNSNETLYDCRHIRTDGFISYAYNGTIPNNSIDENDLLYFGAASETSGTTKSSRQSSITTYENTIVIEPLQDVVILTVENTTMAEDYVILEQGTTTGGTIASKSPEQPRPPKHPQR
jgi:hypothetical protein